MAQGVVQDRQGREVRAREVTLRIYVSSKIRHAAMWQGWRGLGEPIVSSWIDLEPGEASSKEIGHVHWPRWLAEAHGSHALIFYAANGDDNHTGCLLEFGAALAGGSEILIVGDSPTFKTTMGHRADFMTWKRMPTVAAAFKYVHENIEPKLGLAARDAQIDPDGYRIC
jgi:hypothetical protein